MHTGSRALRDQSAADMNNSNFAISLPLTLALIGISLALPAQTVESAASTAARPTQAIVKTWSDWSKICTSDQSTPVCQIVQSANQDETGNLIAMTAIGYVSDNDRPIIYLTAPLGIFLPRGISVVIDQNEPMTAIVQRCDGNGCVGVLAMDEAMIKALLQGTSAKIVFGATAQQNVAIPLSLIGFKDAFSSLTPTGPTHE